MRKIFGPARVPEKFSKFPKEMALRPSQLRATAIELMTARAFAMHRQYATLKTPLVIIAGDQDRLVNISEQSARLNRDVKQSRFWRVPNSGHMVHQTATARLMEALDEAVTWGHERASKANPRTV